MDHQNWFGKVMHWIVMAVIAVAIGLMLWVVGKIVAMFVKEG